MISNRFQPIAIDKVKNRLPHRSNMLYRLYATGPQGEREMPALHWSLHVIFPGPLVLEAAHLLHTEDIKM
jgi:hypothetical protein